MHLLTWFRLAVIGILAGLLAAVVAAASLPKLGHAPTATGQPSNLGRINDSIDVDFHVGNVAIPNRLIQVEHDRSSWQLDHRLRFWDAFLTTAPSPDVYETSNGITLQIPWTLLPSSVASTIQQLDPSFGSEIETWLALKRSAGEWAFDRIEMRDVPRDAAYYRVTGVRTVYSVNLFEFLGELGDDYRANLKRAISSATKEVLELSASRGESKVAIPALAGAEHVVDEHLVLSYRDSFEAILDGISRTQGNTPSRVILVIWNEVRGHPEFDSAIQGLEMASLRKIPEWSVRLRTQAGISVAIAVVVGILASHVFSRDRRHSAPMAVLFSALALVATILGHKYLGSVITVLPLTDFPAIEIGALSALGTVLGFVLHGIGLATFDSKDKGEAVGQSA